MKIKLNLYTFLAIILFFLTGQIEIYILVMLFSLIHELSHMICGVILGFKINAIRILPLGFSIDFQPTVCDYNKKILKSNVISLKKIIVAFAGPLINFIIFIIGVVNNWNNNIIYANFLIFIFNMIPIYPLDGGRILKSTFKIFLGHKKANIVMNTISNTLVIILTIVSSIAIMIYKNIAIPLIVLNLWIIQTSENKKYNTYNKIYKVIDKNYNYL